MILMLVCSKIIRSKLIEICKTNDHWLMSQAVTPLLNRCEVISIYGHDDQAGVRVFENIAHFFDWMDGHPDAEASLEWGLTHYSDIEEGDSFRMRCVPRPSDIYDLVHQLNNNGLNPSDIVLYLSSLGAYCSFRILSEKISECRTLNETLGSVGVEYIETLLDNRIYDPATLNQEFDYIDLISLFSVLRVDHRIRKTTRRQTVSKLELKALNKWYICIKNPGGSLKDAPPFPTIESAQSWLADHPQTKALQAVFKASRMQTSKHDLRATLMWLGIDP